MRNTRFLTSMMMTLGLLAGTAGAAMAARTDSAMDGQQSELNNDHLDLLPDSGGMIALGKPPKNPPTATPEPTAEPPGGGSLGEMHVDFVVVSYNSTQDTYGICRASIVDGDGNPIDGAQVTFDTSAPFAGQFTVTQTLGQNYDVAWLEQRRRERYSCGKRGIPETFTCTVANVYQFDYTYAPELNVETTDFALCGGGN